MIIVDASLAAKWVFWEAQSDAALSFWNSEAGNLGAPDLIALEVAGAIVRRANIDKSLREDMNEALVKWTRLLSGTSVQQFRLTTSRTMNGAKIAISLGHPLKDCIYLVLAMELDCELITCDAKFAAKAIDVWPKVRVLEGA